MPKLLGMEPSTVQKAKPFLLIGGGGLLLYLILKGRGGPAVAAEAPSGATPPMGVQSPGAAPELTQSGSIVDALQQQMQQKQLEYDTAASNLALQGQAQQLRFQSQQQQIELQSQQHTAEQTYYLQQQQGKLAHEQVRSAQGKNTPWYDKLTKIVTDAAQIYTATQGVPAQPTQHVSSNVKPTVNPGPWGVGF